MKSKKTLLIIAILVIVPVLVSCSGGTEEPKDVEEASKNAERTETEEEVKEGTGTSEESKWEKVITFEGESIKDTETFKISSEEWRINWDTKPGELGEMNFQIYVYDADGNPVDPFVVANIVGKGNDISYIRGSGEYYLTINTAQPYSVTIEEKK